ncbi:MAG TPA: hypothetical protein VLV76_23145 [Candidatus Acidoferrum sp.]|nr:hypothetical protein [Candidatus Acidoferrum sp.]
MIYWLYHRQRPIFATIAPPHATDAEVRERALAQYALVPLCHPDYDPTDFTALLRMASVHYE